MHRCDGCQASFHSETELVVHSADCHVTVPDPDLLFKDRPSPLVPQPSPQSVAEGGFACTICDKKFKKETHLSQHLQVHEVKQWECDVCKKSFTTKYFLKKHKRLHTGQQICSLSMVEKLVIKIILFQERRHTRVPSVVNLSPSNSRITNTCSITLMRNPTLATNVEGLSRSCRHFRTTKGFTAERGRLHVKLVEKVSGREFPIWSTGKLGQKLQLLDYFQSKLIYRRIHTGVMPYVCEHCNKKFRYKVTQRTHKCPGKPEPDLLGDIQLPMSSQMAAGLLENPEEAARKKLPNLPLQIQEDLERFRRQNRKNNKTTSSYNEELSSSHQVENSAAVSVIATPEEPQVPYPLASNEVETEHMNPLGQLQLLSINEANAVMNQPPQYPNFFGAIDLEQNFL